MESKIVKHDFSKLDKFVRSLKTDMVVQVGIFGQRNYRADLNKPRVGKSDGGVYHQGHKYPRSAQTNADIGFKHEFGKGVPMRSFLRMPIFQHAEDILFQVKKAGALKKLAAGKMIQVLTDLGIACEATVLQSFSSGGWGSWKKNAASTIKRKGSASPLIDTGQLRRSISSAVVNAV